MKAAPVIVLLLTLILLGKSAWAADPVAPESHVLPKEYLLLQRLKGDFDLAFTMNTPDGKSNRGSGWWKGRNTAAGYAVFADFHLIVPDQFEFDAGTLWGFDQTANTFSMVICGSSKKVEMFSGKLSGEQTVSLHSEGEVIPGEPSSKELVWTIGEHETVVDETDIIAGEKTTYRFVLTRKTDDGQSGR